MRWLRLWLFPVIFLVLLLYGGLNNYDILNNPHSVAQLYWQNLKKGKFSYGLEGKYYNRISFADLEPGDILVGGYPKCSYGRFSHAGIYIGDNLVMESYGDLGVTTQPINHFWDYSEIALLKVEVSPEIKNNAIDYIKNYEGGLFYPVAFKPGDRIWNCTKIIWKAYLEQGIDLDENKDIWVTPEAFYHSSWTTVIREKGR